MLRDLFEREANAIWRALRKLAQDDPSLERLYAIDADPRVSGLVQTGAFVFASARATLEDDDQILSRPLIAAALPSALRPRPASTIVQRTFRTGVVRDLQGHTVSAFSTEGPITFDVVWSAPVAPIEISLVRLDRIHAQKQLLRLDIAGKGGAALGSVMPERLRIFVHLEPRRVALDLIHALRDAGDAIQVKSFAAAGRLLGEANLPSTALRWVRVDTDEPPLVPGPQDRFPSGCLLGDLFSFPESFNFIDIELPRSLRRENLGRLELTFPLAGVVEDAADISPENVRLFCAPATNSFLSPIEPLEAAEGASEWMLSVAGKPHAEILYLRKMFIDQSTDAGGRRELTSWEAPSTPHAFEPDEIYYRLRQRVSAEGMRTEMHASFATMDQFYAPAPAAFVYGEVLASDGALAGSLGIGDVQGAGVANITQPSPSHRAPLGKNHATRVGAYARMPPRQFAEPAHLTEFVRLHDSSEQAHGRSRIRTPEFLYTHHAREHTLEAGALCWGDAYDVDISMGPCSKGEAWLVGELVSRAIAERAEVLDFTRLIFIHGEGRQRRIFSEYATRSGQRLPFPLG